MSPGEVAAILFTTFGVLIVLRVPVSFALGLACVPVFFIDDRLTPILLLNEMFKSYNAFVLLAVPFFLLAANLMNTAGITAAPCQSVARHGRPPAGRARPHQCGRVHAVRRHLRVLDRGRRRVSVRC